MIDLSIGCMNVRGIRNSEKRRDVFNFMRNLNFSIVCLIDTHISCEMFNFVRAEWGGRAFFSPGTAHSRGVVMLIHNNLGFDVFGMKIDDDGNFIILDVELEGIGRCTLVTLYGPNDDSPGFYRSVFSFVRDFDNDKMIMVGDWNVTLDPKLDSERYVSLGNRRARDVILDFMDQENMSDIWRMQHAAKRSFTWRRSSPLKLARLDYFLVSAAIVRMVKSSDILAGYRTDHSLISLVLHEPGSKQAGSFLEI